MESSISGIVPNDTPLISEAFTEFHLQGVVHRDLKPANILITDNGADVKIIDFGLSDADRYAILKQPAGTLGFSAPEQMGRGNDAGKEGADVESPSPTVSYTDVRADAQELSEKLDNAEDDLSSSQMSRYIKITSKLASAAADMSY